MQTSAIRISALLFAAAITFNSCENDRSVSNVRPTPEEAIVSQEPGLQGKPVTRELTVASIRTSPEENIVLFCQNPQVLKVNDAAVLKTLQNAKQLNQKVNVTFHPWTAEVTKAELISTALQAPARTEGITYNLNSTTMDGLDDASKLGIINMTSPATGLTNVVPDFTTAQLMFTYISKQCCALPGPYGVDYCIPFQYAYDGCYARAHKMCWIINNKYHYGTHKIFSFANAGSDVLSVQGQKWGGCCINWWYHVAPLVNVNTPTGVKAYVFDPAMFDQPVLLSVWLHAQKNPVCGAGANVTMINIQPTTSFWPSDYTGYAFDPDPTYYYTNYYLNYYSTMTTCF
ncbi:MAG: protein-glutamine glutaminase family protein [Bacteroidia bacterium]